jgi:L-serine dehydratase
MKGDFFETLLAMDQVPHEALDFLSRNCAAEEILHLQSRGRQMVEIKSTEPLGEDILSAIRTRYPIRHLRQAAPVVPILSRRSMSVPFGSAAEMLRYNESPGLELWELALRYESERGDIGSGEVFKKMESIAGILEQSINDGIRGTERDDRILGHQSGRYMNLMEENGLLNGGMLNRMILYVTALMEVKSSMGIIVAAPTAGACGTVPGALFGAAGDMDSSPEELVRAFLAAGIIGVLIVKDATFAAEEGGCQAECGAASGMAAAALVALARGSTRQALSAASMALQNTLGMICDPVANRVEVPCLGKNVMAAVNAFACANMALAGFDEVIPLDEVITTMDRVGRSIPCELRCTGLGGLSVTETSRKIENRLKRQ